MQIFLIPIETHEKGLNLQQLPQRLIRDFSVTASDKICLQCVKAGMFEAFQSRRELRLQNISAGCPDTKCSRHSCSRIPWNIIDKTAIFWHSSDKSSFFSRPPVITVRSSPSVRSYVASRDIQWRMKRSSFPI